MSDKETKERIEEEAEDAVKNDDAVNYQDEGIYIYGYIAGATSEHQKAWNEAIDAAIEMMKENPIGLDAIDEEYLERLEALKHQQP